MNKTLYVDPSANADDTTFHCIKDALKGIDSNDKNFYNICIAPGVYRERVEIWHDNLRLFSKSGDPGDTVITGSLGAFDLMEDGEKRGTFRSYTMLVAASNVTLENLTILNESGDPLKAGQAIALYADGDDITVTGCHIKSRQDTLFTGPLPPKEIKPGGFIGPLQHAPRIQGHQLYKNCLISGDVDFIFGGAAAIFEDCTIESVPHRPQKADTDMNQGYVTAPSTPEGAEEGYSFIRCRFIGNGLRDSTVYLSRPWRIYAAATFRDCEIGYHIRPEGFHDWDKPESHETVRYVVSGCRRPDGAPYIPEADFATVTD